MTVFAMVFPGQGSQKVGMLKKLAMYYPLVKQTFDEASVILGYDLWNFVQNGPIEELNKTWQAQPSLLAASVAIWRIWRQQGGRLPTMLAGHSLGEYSALVCAGSLDFKIAIKLVAQRGELMCEAVPDGTGAMSAIIGLDKKIVYIACEQAAQGEVVSPVNFNSPNQTVIAGHKKAVERACMFCKKFGAKRISLLPITVPSHCILMKPTAAKFSQILKTIRFNIPQIPIVNNVDVRIEQNPILIRKALVRQLYSPVRWIEIIKYLSVKNELLLEVGPGQVLTGLIKNIMNAPLSIAINDPDLLATAIKY